MGRQKNRTGGPTYVYRTVRHDGRTIRRYVGPLVDPVVRLVSDIEELESANHQAAREASRVEHQEYRAAEEELRRFGKRVELMLRAERGRIRPRQQTSRRTVGDTPVDTNQAKLDDSPTLPSRAEFDALLARAEEGDSDSLRRLRMLLKTHPSIWEAVTDFPKQAEESLIKLIAGDSPFLAESLRCRLDEMRKDLRFIGDGPIERLLVERVVLSWLDLNFTQISVIESRERRTDSRAWGQRVDRAQRRHLAAVKALRIVRA
jgi:hypothetical protein